MRQDANQPNHSKGQPKKSRRKHCKNCKELFESDPRAKERQKYCSKSQCQTVRQRKNENHWRQNNPEAVAYQKSKWQKKHPGYSQQRRAADPQGQEKNRQDTKIRMQQRRWEAMFEKSKVILTQVVGNNSDKCCLIGGHWLFLRLKRASPLRKAAVVMHTGWRLKRITNRLPKSKVYDLSGMFKKGSSHG